MPVSLAPVSAWVFGPFRLRVDDRILERNGERVLLAPKVVDTLLVLVENRGQVVSKETLIKSVWPDVTVVESGLSRNICVLRKALEDGMPEGSVIETIPRRGYRFVAEITEECEAAPPPAVAPPRGRFRLRWPALAAVALAGLSVSVSHPSRPALPPPVDPHVRIGEHLLYKLSPEETVRASGHFQQAIAASPGSAAAYAGLSVALLQMSALGQCSLPEVAERAAAAGRRALELDPDLAAAHYANGLLNLLHRWHTESAETEFRRALQLEPASVQTRCGYAQLKFATGQVAEAIRLIEEALRLDPASPRMGARYCQALYFARDYRRAEAECRKVLDREPRFAMAQYYLALSLGWLGRTNEARQSLDRAWLSLRDGHPRPAWEALERRRELIRRGKLNATANLLLCTMLGRNDEAFEAIEAGISARAIEVLTLNVDPRLASLSTDPRYPAVLRRIGIAGLPHRKQPRPAENLRWRTSQPGLLRK